MEDAAAFARLIRALRPWLWHLVIVGGWAHRLHRLHPLAAKPPYTSVRTRDVDLALSMQAPLEGDIRQALEEAGFERHFLGSDTPPVTHYTLGEQEDAGFYAEFLTPLLGSEHKRDRMPDSTASKAGINAQKLRYLDLLLAAPWSVHLDASTAIAFNERIDILVANPISFIVQKLLIHEKRNASKRAQDILYIHDTLELFGAALDELRSVWRDQIRPGVPAKTAARVEKLAQALVEEVTDPIREAARIPQDRRLTPEIMRAACEYGLGTLFE